MTMQNTLLRVPPYKLERAGSLVEIQNDGDIVLTPLAGRTITLGGAVTLSGAIDMANNVITNIGAAGTDFTGTGGLTLADILTVSAGGMSITGASTLAQGTIVAAAPVLDATTSWNNGAVTFTGIKLNVTNTASAAASLLMDLQVGSVSKFAVKNAISGTLSGTSLELVTGSNISIGSPSQSGIANTIQGFAYINANQTFGVTSLNGNQTTLKLGGNYNDTDGLLIYNQGNATPTAENVHFAAGNGLSLTIGGSFATQRFTVFYQPTITAASALTVTTGVNVDIGGAPTIAASALITNTIALRAGGAVTMANIASSQYMTMQVPAHTVTLNATTQITSTTFASALTLDVITIAQSGGAVIVDSAATLDIVGPPAAGASVTLTTPLALKVRSGNSSFGGQISNTFTSIVSTPAETLTGTWYTGGSATTTKPHLLIEPAGTTSTGWSTSGTGLGINAAAGFVGNLLDLQVNAAKKFGFGATAILTIYRDSLDTQFGSISVLGNMRLNSANGDIEVSPALAIADQIGGSVYGKLTSVIATTSLNISANSGGRIIIDPGTPNATAVEFISLSILGVTLTITGSYATQRFVNWASPTITAASALTITEVIAHEINGPLPAGSAIFTDSVALNLPTYATNGTTASGLRIAAPTGASSNWAINVIGGGSIFAPAAVAAGLTALTITQGAHTAVVAEQPAFSISTATITLADTTTVAEYAWARIAAPTFAGVAAGGAEVITDAATLLITGDPINGGNITLTRSYALWNKGKTRYGDNVHLDDTKVLQAQSGVIGFGVVSTALTLGSAGSIIAPFADMGNAANDAARDALAGNVDGCTAIDSVGVGGVFKIWARVGGAWKSATIA